MIKVPAKLYIAFVVLAATSAYAYKLRTTGVFACAAALYDQNNYLSYCQAANYADYDHGAFWFGLQPAAVNNASSADVLFLGSSRTQFGFSSTATRQWFSARGISHFLLGFGNNANTEFIAPLLRKLKPDASAYVINIDRFFDDTLSGPAASVLHDPGSESMYRSAARWQSAHQLFCAHLTWVCGNRLAFFREEKNGYWNLNIGDQPLRATAIGLSKPDDVNSWPKFVERGEAFVRSLPVQSGCVFLTLVPSENTRLDEAKHVASSLGLPLVYPGVDKLKTFDSSHLDASSATKWASAVLKEIGDSVATCVGGKTVP